MIRPHLRYLRYVLAHKWYVLRAGLAIRKHVLIQVNPVAWVWRLLVHDLSKFSRAEWGPYVRSFYGPTEMAWVQDRADQYRDASELWNDPAHEPEVLRLAAKDYAEYKRDVRADFNAAWLHHIHQNPHHWQHHILLEDSGRTIVLVPPAVLAWEMVADWLAAGPKALRMHSMQEAVAETIVWYAANHKQMQMREQLRGMAEYILIELAVHYGVKNAASEIESAARTRASITIPGR